MKLPEPSLTDCRVAFTVMGAIMNSLHRVAADMEQDHKKISLAWTRPRVRVKVHAAKTQRQFHIGGKTPSKSFRLKDAFIIPEQMLV
jgi:hypothetical protein